MILNKKHLAKPFAGTGAYAEDWVRWQGQLCTLYDALVSEISQIGSRGKYATGSRPIAVKENLIELTADVCHQVINVVVLLNNLLLLINLFCL